MTQQGTLSYPQGHQYPVKNHEWGINTILSQMCVFTLLQFELAYQRHHKAGKENTTPKSNVIWLLRSAFTLYLIIYMI